MLVSGELSITRVAPELAAAGVVSDPVAAGLDELEQAATPAASRPAAATATNRLWLTNLFISVLSPRGVCTSGTSSYPLSGLVHVPARGRSGDGERQQGRVLLAAVLISERTPRAERAALGGETLRGLHPLDALRAGAIAAGAQGAAQVVGVGCGAHQQLGIRVLGLLGDLLCGPALDDLARVHDQDLVSEVAR